MQIDSLQLFTCGNQPSIKDAGLSNIYSTRGVSVPSNTESVTTADTQQQRHLIREQDRLEKKKTKKNTKAAPEVLLRASRADHMLHKLHAAPQFSFLPLFLRRQCSRNHPDQSQVCFAFPPPPAP